MENNQSNIISQLAPGIIGLIVGALLGIFWKSQPSISSQQQQQQQQPTRPSSSSSSSIPSTSSSSSSSKPSTSYALGSEDDMQSEEDEEDEEDSSSGEDDFPPALRYYHPKEEHKMVFVVRTDLKMKPGKIAAQCCHAAIGSYQVARRHSPLAVQYWELTAAAKVAVKVDSAEALLALRQQVRARGLPHYLVTDAGRTQIPSGSQTVLGIGPAPKSIIDQITGHLKLL